MEGEINDYIMISAKGLTNKLCFESKITREGKADRRFSGLDTTGCRRGVFKPRTNTGELFEATPLPGVAVDLVNGNMLL